MENYQKINIKKVNKRRTYPFHQLKQAQTIGQAIHDANSGFAIDRFLLAKALKTTPKSSGFIIKLNSSVRYGITNGGYNDPTISLTELGRAIVSAKTPEEYQRALVECSIKPDVFRNFYQRMDGKQLPEESYAKNILERDHQVDQDLSGECYHTIVANGLHANIILEVKGVMYVNLSGALESQNKYTIEEQHGKQKYQDKSSSYKTGSVFIGHFGDMQILKVIEDMLYEFNIKFQVVNLKEFDANQLIGRVNNELNDCQAGIILAGATSETDQINEFKLPIIIGAASALYNGKVVLIGRTQFVGNMDKLGLNIVYVTEESSISEMQILKALNNTKVINITV